MMRIIDQFSDVSFRPVIQLITQNPQFREMTKHASLDLEENQTVPATAFAWPEERLFRIDTPDNAVLSKLFIEKQAGAIPPDVKARCDTALRVFGHDPEQIRPEKQASTAITRYVFPEDRAVPVRSAHDYKLASAMLTQNLRRMDPKMRTYTAVRMVKVGASINETPPDWAVQYAGMTICEVPKLVEFVEARAAITDSPTIKYAFDQLAEAVNALGVRYYDNFDDLSGLAEKLAQLDDMAHLSKYYTRGLPDPILSVFNTTKLAEDLVLLGGQTVPLEQLLAVPVDVYAAIFGDDFVDEITTGNDLDPDKLRAVLPTMPADLLRVFLHQLGRGAA